MTTLYFSNIRLTESKVLDLRSCSGRPGLEVRLKDVMEWGAEDRWKFGVKDGAKDGGKEVVAEG